MWLKTTCSKKIHFSRIWGACLKIFSILTLLKKHSDFYKLIDDHLGSGAYACVKTGVSLTTGKEFAVKLIDKHEASHTRARVMHEVETFNLCKNHPNIVQLHEVQYFIVALLLICSR